MALAACRLSADTSGGRDQSPARLRERSGTVTNSEIAAVFGLTESRICQIHAQTILGLRAYLQRVRER